MAATSRAMQLSEVIRFGNGKAIKPGGEGCYPVYGSNGIIGGCDEFRYENGVIIGRVGAYCGSVAYCPEKFWASDNTLVAFPASEQFDTKFLFYLLTDAKLSRYAGGAAQPLVTQTVLKQVEVSVPPLPVQRRIAGILSAYDELIENNKRRIKILEEMARSLYREWFVNFRFPGHEKIPLVDSTLGTIPKGWEVKTVADLCESVSYGFTASAVREEIGPKFLRITDIVPDIIDWEDVPFCEIAESKSLKYHLEPGDIVVARTGATTGYAKRLNKRHPDTVFASYLVRVRAGVGFSNRILGILMESDDYKQFIKTNIGGAAQPQANAVVLTSMQLAAPPPPLAQHFDRLVEPLSDQTEILSEEIKNLRRTCNLLLPRLLSGQLHLN
jgi:type I restriction enzyme S subunit